ncbi:hypothetical protein DFH09DRAFT_1283140 [Mycena vulgaris]|nr:hypothetical protein DFH09DRAFT_1283140 [Mycena vulgaris]
MSTPRHSGASSSMRTPVPSKNTIPLESVDAQLPDRHGGILVPPSRDVYQAHHLHLLHALAAVHVPPCPPRVPNSHYQLRHHPGFPPPDQGDPLKQQLYRKEVYNGTNRIPILPRLAPINLGAILTKRLETGEDNAHAMKAICGMFGDRGTKIPISLDVAKLNELTADPELVELREEKQNQWLVSMRKLIWSDKADEVDTQRAVLSEIHQQLHGIVNKDNIIVGREKRALITAKRKKSLLRSFDPAVARIQRLCKSHWSHHVAYLACALEWLHPPNSDVNGWWSHWPGIFRRVEPLVADGLKAIDWLRWLTPAAHIPLASAHNVASAQPTSKVTSAAGQENIDPVSNSSSAAMNHGGMNVLEALHICVAESAEYFYWIHRRNSKDYAGLLQQTWINLRGERTGKSSVRDGWTVKTIQTHLEVRRNGYCIQYDIGDISWCATQNESSAVAAWANSRTGTPTNNTEEVIGPKRHSFKIIFTPVASGQS